MQTGREAIESLIRGGTADFVPLYDNPWGDTLKLWATQGMPVDDEGKPVDSTTHFGFDMVGCGGWYDWQPIRGHSEIVEETDEWKVVRNGAGAVLKWWKEKSGTPEHVDFDMTDRATWEEKYRPLLVDFDPERVRGTDVTRSNVERRREEGRWAFYGCSGIWEQLRGSLGDYTMLTALIEDPDWIHDFCRVHTDLRIQCYKIYFEEAGLPDGIWLYDDLGYKERLYCSPDTLGELIFPYYKDFVDFVHSYDLPIVLHTCGYTEPAIPLVIDAGFDALNPMEAKAGNDLFAIAERYGDQLMFVGGLDARIFESGDRDAIRDGVTRHIEGLKERGARFVYGSDHSLSTNIPYDDFLYSLDVYKSLKDY